MELVSVVVPAFNAERFVARTLASALAQTYENLEVIVVDDGSTDNTRSVVEACAAGDRRLQIFSTPNRGVARARNLGIENARGVYVAFLDADDLWHPTKIERQVEALNIHRSDPAWGGVYTFHRTINADDQVTGSGQTLAGCRGYVLARDLVLKFIGNGSNLLVHREAALAVGGFDPSYADIGIGGCEDLDFELRLAARYRIEAVRSFLVGYRIYNGNMSSDGSRMARSMIEAVSRHAELNPSIAPRVKRWALGNGYRYAFQVLLRERQLLSAVAAYAKLVLSDPVLSMIAAMEVLQAIIERLGRDRPVGSPRPFLAVDPEEGKDDPVDAIAWLKQGRLTDEDRSLEEGEFFEPDAGHLAEGQEGSTCLTGDAYRR
ncbi:glycosyltransferase family 2 protein [Bradyrhizobium xenonodulans]|uniref:Glycosyltransferase family 2 protein n=1 Tax=Bradyrhizobium xenonodulans TaxID=2736875 RepID=A0ABY7MPQ5_9BRAD|nr:glycosyltransferase family A protein [Bradyrhizobium xenonodulans]WBL80329.1 glycosyltransferase family 2 protein [Bradyrhizobium xenonodulans]